MKKDIIHNKCGKTYVIEYTERGLPILVCSGCDHKIEDWVKWEERYSKFWEDPSKWEEKKDSVVCLLGHFVNLYKQYYGANFTFSLNDRGLFKGPEAHHVRKLLTQFNQNAKEARSFMDWLFKTKVQGRKKKITSLGFLHTEAIVNEFKLLQQKNKLRTRSTPLSDGMIKWINKFAPSLSESFELKDFGDLRSLLGHFKAGRVSGEHISGFVEKLKSANIIDEELQIANWSD